MIKTLDKFPFFSPTGNGRIACRPYDAFCLLKGILLTKVPRSMYRCDTRSQG